MGKVTADVPNFNYEEKMNREIIGSVGNGGPKVKVRTNVGAIEFVVDEEPISKKSQNGS